MKPQKEKEKAEWRLQKHLEIKQELLQNEQLKTYLEGAYPNSRASFIDEYASQKVRWLEWGPKFQERLEKEDLQWIEDATTRLKEIQQKKLFDLQCLWRAEKITLPDIKLTIDFSSWEYDILNCPFLPAVTEEEVDMYIQYLQSENFQHEQGFLERWQDYEQIKNAHNDGNADRNFPDWYDFHNGRTGLSVYLLLPDVRGEKEKFYFDLWRAEVMKNQAEKKKEVAAAEPRLPSLPYHQKGWLSWFVKTYEDKETQQMFERYGGEWVGSDFDDEQLEADLNLLGRADRVVPITGWYDWKEAIHKAADRYRREKISEALPVAFERYQMNVELQIPFSKNEQNERMRSIFDNEWYVQAILRGRELNGEPRNLNF